MAHKDVKDRLQEITKRTLGSAIGDLDLLIDSLENKNLGRISSDIKEHYKLARIPIRGKTWRQNEREFAQELSDILDEVTQSYIITVQFYGFVQEVFKSAPLSPELEEITRRMSERKGHISGVHLVEYMKQYSVLLKKIINKIGGSKIVSLQGDSKSK